MIPNSLPPKLELSLHNWRQFTSAKFCIDLQQSFMLLDNNGQGKTSLLSAFYSLFTGQAFPGTKFSNCLRQGSQYFGLSTGDKNWHLSGQIGSSGRLINKFQPPSSTSQRLITYQTKDNYWLLQTREQKLKDLDILLMQVETIEYAKLSSTLQKFLRAKQNLIRHYQQNNNIDYSLLFNLNQNILDLSQQIWAKRREFFEFLSSSLVVLNDWLELDIQPAISIRHEISNASGARQSFETAPKPDLEIINQLWPREVLSGQILFGAQRDNFLLSVNHQPIETFLSSGQLRILTIFIKVISSQFNRQPAVANWFIFDDVFEEIDAKRQTILFEQILSQADFYILTGSKKPKIKALITKNLNDLSC